MDLYWLQRIYDKLVSGITVTQDAKDRTISNVPTIAPSGDMGRKALYDRSAINRTRYYNASVPADAGATEKWGYTVPNGKKALVTVYWLRISVAIATAGCLSHTYQTVQPSVGGAQLICVKYHTDTDGYITSETNPDTKFLFEGDKICGWVYNNDTVAHTIGCAQAIVEFDE